MKPSSVNRIRNWSPWFVIDDDGTNSGVIVLYLTEVFNLDIFSHFVFPLQAYLEDFYNFCKKMGGATAEVMCEALGVGLDVKEVSAHWTVTYTCLTDDMKISIKDVDPFSVYAYMPTNYSYTVFVQENHQNQ